MSLLRTVAAGTLGIALLLAASSAGGAIPGYDARYFGESAFVVLQPGQSNQFAVGFTNTGSIGWARGGASQVNLAQCCPINGPSPNSTWAVNWLSTTAYATTTTDYVGPVQIGWFVYTVKAPSTAAAGNYRFDGDLVLGSTGEALNRQGYFQVATVPAPVGSGGAIPSAVASVSCLNLREIKVQFGQAMAKSGAGSVTDRDHYTLSGGLEIDGGRASPDGTSVVLTVGRSVTGAGLHDGAQLSTNPYTFMAQNATYSLTLQNVMTAAFQLTWPATTSFTCTDSTGPAVIPSSIAGAGSVIVAFSEPMDPSTLTAGVIWDNLPMSSIGRLRWQDRSGNVCAAANGCFTTLRLDFLKTTIPAEGNHLLLIRDAKDAAGLKLSPNPYNFYINMPGPSSGTPPEAGDAVVSAVGGSLRIDVTFSDPMAHSANGFDSSESFDTVTNYVLRNPDGSPATTTAGAVGGTLITIDRVLPSLASDISLVTDERQLLRDALAFELRRVRLVLGPSGEALGRGAGYTLEIRNVKDESGVVISMGTFKTLVWAGDATPPQALRAFASATQLRVDYSESMLLDPSAGTATNAGDPARYSADPPLQSSLAGMTFARLSDDGTGVVFDLRTPLAAGTYVLTVTDTRDPFGNALSPSPTRVALTAIDTQRR